MTIILTLIIMVFLFLIIIITVTSSKLGCSFLLFHESAVRAIIDAVGPLELVSASCHHLAGHGDKAVPVHVQEWVGPAGHVCRMHVLHVPQLIQSSGIDMAEEVGVNVTNCRVEPCQVVLHPKLEQALTGVPFAELLLAVSDQLTVF